MIRKKEKAKDETVPTQILKALWERKSNDLHDYYLHLLKSPARSQSSIRSTEATMGSEDTIPIVQTNKIVGKKRGKRIDSESEDSDI